MHRSQFKVNGNILLTRPSAFLPRTGDYIMIQGKTYIAIKVLIDIRNEFAYIDLEEVS